MHFFFNRISWPWVAVAMSGSQMSVVLRQRVHEIASAEPQSHERVRIAHEGTGKQENSLLFGQLMAVLGG